MGRGASKEPGGGACCSDQPGGGASYLSGFPVSGKDKYNGGVCGADGKIYGVPANAQYVLSIDPSSGSYEYLDTVHAGTQKWLRGVLAKDGFVYCIPCWSGCVLKIDTRPDRPEPEAPANPDESGWTQEEDAVLSQIIRELQPMYPDTNKWWQKVAQRFEKQSSKVVKKADIMVRADYLEKLKPKRETFLYPPDHLKEAFSGRWKWHGGVLGSDGDIYAVPCNAPGVLRIKTQTGELDIIGDPELFRDRQLWYGAVSAHDGGIYAFPHNAPGVLKIKPDPASNKTEVSVIGTGVVEPGDWKWHGGVYCKFDKCVYAIPNNSDKVLRIDPDGNDGKGSVQLFGDGTVIEKSRHREDGKYKYEGAVVAEDGNIYCIPGDAERVLKIITPKGKDDEPGVENIGPYFTEVQSNKWQNGFMASDGCIYAVPLRAEGVLKVDVTSQEVSEVFVDGQKMPGKDKWQSGAFGPDGCFYCMPFMSDKVLRIAPEPKQ